MVWNFFAQLLIGFVISVVAYALAPKPRQPHLEAPDQKEPTSEPGLAIPIVYGTVTVRGVNVLHFTDKHRQKLKNGRARYRMSVHYGICQGPIDAIRRVRIGERVASGEVIQAAAVRNLYDTEFFGGDQREGGISGRMYILTGTATQKQHAFVAGKYGESPDTMPGDRGVATVMFTDWPSAKLKGFLWGNTPVVPAVDVMVSAFPQWYPEKAQIPAHPDIVGPHEDEDSGVSYSLGPNCNPAHILWDAVTNPKLTNRILPSQIDEATFRESADAWFDEGFGLSFEWRAADQPRKDFITEVLNHADAAMFVHPDTGLLTLRRLDGAYDEAALPVYDDMNTTVRRLTRTPAGELPNQFSVKWRNPINEEPEAATVQNLAGIVQSGSVLRDRSYDFAGVRDPATAWKVAERELTEAGSGLVTADVEVDRSAWRTVPADVLKLSSTPEAVDELVMRVVNINQGRPGDSKITLNLIEDVFGRTRPDFRRQVQGGTPSTPRNFRLVQGPGRVEMHWDRPTDEGASPIFAYEYQQNFGAWRRIPGLETEHTVTGLVDGNTYTFRVRAVNLAGPGTPTVPLTIGPDNAQARVPGVPQDFYGIVDGDDIELYWEPPLSNGGATISHYEYEILGLPEPVMRPVPGEPGFQTPGTGPGGGQPIGPTVGPMTPVVPQVDKRGPTVPIPASQDAYLFKSEGRQWANRPGRTLRWSHATRDLSGTDSLRQSYLNGGDMTPDLLQATRDAFAMFAKWLNVNFQEVADAADVDIRIAYGDAASGLTAIAWAIDFRPWSPLRKSAIAYNSLYIDRWIGRTPEHEVGHVLGLLHPDQSPNDGGEFRDHLMETIGHSREVQFDPQPGDIIGLQHLWGPNPNAPATIPDAPSAFRAVSGTGSVSLTWDEPLINGGRDIEGYEVTIRDGTDEFSVGASGTGYDDIGLRTGQARAYRLQARNSVGLGLSTQWVTVVVG